MIYMILNYIYIYKIKIFFYTNDSISPHTCVLFPLAPARAILPVSVGRPATVLLTGLSPQLLFLLFPVDSSEFLLHPLI